MAKEKFANVKALKSFRLKGAHIAPGDVVAKSDFATKSDWQNLVHMEPARCEETDEKVGKAKAAPKAKASKAAAKKEGEGEGEGLPGA